jgi:hypothetical protein
LGLQGIHGFGWLRRVAFLVLEPIDSEQSRVTRTLIVEGNFEDLSGMTVHFVGDFMEEFQ